MDSIGVNEHKEPHEVKTVSSNSAIVMNHLNDSNDDKSYLPMSNNEQNVIRQNSVKGDPKDNDCERHDGEVCVYFL